MWEWEESEKKKERFHCSPALTTPRRVRDDDLYDLKASMTDAAYAAVCSAGPAISPDALGSYCVRGANKGRLKLRGGPSGPAAGLDSVWQGCGAPKTARCAAAGSAIRRRFPLAMAGY
jgi:hypothetical protein